MYKSPIEILISDIKRYRKGYTDGAKDFAAKLKAKANRPEHPWEDSPVCESDIDEVLKEMVGDD